MPYFRYHIIDRMGHPRQGHLVAENREAALARLQRMECYVIDLDLAAQVRGPLQRWLEPLQRVHPKALTYFSRQFAVMINAGIPLTQCLDALELQTRDRKLIAVVSDIKREVSAGESLTAAFSRHRKVFSQIFLSMLQAGEAGGILDEVLNRLADYLESDLEFRGKVRSALTYPGVVFLFSVGVILFLTFYILPKFEEIFAQLEVPLPWTTRMLLTSSSFVCRHWYVLPAALLIAVLGLRLYGKTAHGRWQIDWILLKIPVVGDLLLKSAVARFSRTFAALTMSGFPILQTLDIVADTAGNRVIGDALRDAQTHVREGTSISDPLTLSGVFPPMVTQMIGAGEASGALEDMLLKIAQFYEAEVDRAVKALTSLIEPLMIVGLGFLVGFVAVSIISPIYDLAGALQKQ